MTVKDYKVVATILACLSAQLKMDGRDEEVMVDLAEAILKQNFEKFDAKQFDKWYEIESQDIVTQIEEIKEDHIKGDNPDGDKITEQEVEEEIQSETGDGVAAQAA